MYRLIKALKVSLKWNSAINLATDNKHTEALKSLEEVSHAMENRDYEFHIFRGRLFFVTGNNEAAIDDFEIAHELLTIDSKISYNDRRYLVVYMNSIRNDISEGSEPLSADDIELSQVSKHFQLKYPIE